MFSITPNVMATSVELHDFEEFYVLRFFFGGWGWLAEMGMSTPAEILNLRILYLLDYYIMSEPL